MSLLDSINNAEAQADKLIEDAKIEARKILQSSQNKAKTVADNKIREAKDDYAQKLAIIEEQIHKKYDNYLENKKNENSKIAKDAQKNLTLASSYIIQQVLNQ